MSMLARYKKGGGIIELVKLVEDSAEPKKTQLMNMIRGEDPEFAARVEAKIFNWDKLKGLPEGSLAEIVSTTPPKFVALALYGEAPEFTTLCEKMLGKNFNDYRQEKEVLVATAPNPAQIESGRRKCIAEARKLEAAGAIKLGGNEPEAAAAGIPAAHRPGGGGASTAGAASTGAAKPGGGTASGDAACPAVETFKLETPPPGLSGERLEVYLKSVLGF